MNSSNPPGPSLQPQPGPDWLWEFGRIALRILHPVPIVCGFSTPPSSSLTSAGCRAPPHHADTVSLEMASDPTGSGLGPPRLSYPQLWMPTASLAYRLVLMTGRLETGGSDDPLFGFSSFSRAALRTQKQFTYWITGLFQKGVTQQQADGREAQGNVCLLQADRSP